MKISLGILTFQIVVGIVFGPAVTWRGTHLEYCLSPVDQRLTETCGKRKEMISLMNTLPWINKG